MSSTDRSPAFEWQPEYETILENVASTDTVETEWPKLKGMIKYKIDKNIAQYLSDAKEASTQPPARISSPEQTALGGLRLPPFPSRSKDGPRPNEGPKAVLNEEETKEMKDAIFAQLEDFEGNPPFTIQRLCELCVRPKVHYKTNGKYLRAVEKTLLVTSTWDTFPIPSKDKPPEHVATLSNSILYSAPTTPLFSPIPFLHGDARRSKSHSPPPPSPLALSAMDPGTGVNDEPAMLGPNGAQQKALGLVDELDDPSPGHLSEHPTALSAVTELGSRNEEGSNQEAEASSSGSGFGLSHRFVSGGSQGGENKKEDEDEDKENKG